MKFSPSLSSATLRLALIAAVCVAVVGALASALTRPAPAEAEVAVQHLTYFPTISRQPGGYPAAPTLNAVQPQWNTVTLSWNAVGGADAYILWRSQNTSFAGAVVVYQGTGTGFSQALGAGAYYFRVQAANERGASASNVRTVVVTPPLTPTPPGPNVCAQISGASYGSLSINGSPSDRPAEAHADLNLALRGYQAVGEARSLVDYNGAADSRAPQLPALFDNNRTPAFVGTYRVYNWNWSTNTRGGLITDWPVTLVGVGTSPGEVIHAPDSGYDIGSGYEALVLYASDTRITLKYTREDNVVYGYTVHLENVCVEPRLLSLYQQRNAQGRGQLPAVRGGQAIGRARGGEVGVAVRDSGRFMDPRSRKDWWRGRLKWTLDGWALYP